MVSREASVLILMMGGVTVTGSWIKAVLETKEPKEITFVVKQIGDKCPNLQVL